MEFVKFSTPIASFNFTHKAKLPGRVEGLEFIDKKGLDKITQDEKARQHNQVEDVLIHLALCHNIVIDKRTGKMNSASPDELALVEGASQQGYTFEGLDA